jgi:hypothetical protein
MRPLSISLTSLVLTWFGIASSVSAVMGTFGSGPGLPLRPLLIVALAAFGLASLATGRALWAMRPASSRLLLVVGAAGALLSIVLSLTLASQLDPGKAWTAGVTGAALFGLFCTWQSHRFRLLLARAV